MKDITLRFAIMLKPEPEGGYTVYIPSLPGCITYGSTIDEAKRMAKEAITAYLESLRKHNEPIPMDDSLIMISTVEMAEMNV